MISLGVGLQRHVSAVRALQMVRGKPCDGQHGSQLSEPAMLVAASATVCLMDVIGPEPTFVR